jgi:hypothetical protein
MKQVLKKSIEFIPYFIGILFFFMLLTIAASSKPVSFRDCNKVVAPLRCKAIKTNGKQCLNASYKCDSVCKFHLNTKNK